jgi:hypothetical protein
MASSGILAKIKILLPTRTKPKGNTQTATFDPERTGDTLDLPAFKEHLANLYDDRINKNSRELMLSLLKADPDASSALSAYLTTADVEPKIIVRDPDGAIDRDGYKLVNEIIEVLTTRRDYSKGYEERKDFRTIAEDLRYMILARGGIAVEAVYNELLVLNELRLVDIAQIQLQEKSPGVMVPWQVVGDKEIKLDIPTFFMHWYRKSPMEAYGNSPFIAAINSMAARQQVINDLYRIMQITGFPRLTVKVLEEVIARSAPAHLKADAAEFRKYLRARRNELVQQFGSIRADQPMVHYDSAELNILNEKNPAVGLDITSIIDVLNAQNQAGLRTMATVLGRGESGVNTATVEAQLFSKNAGSLNQGIGRVFSNILTQALRLQGSESRVEVVYPQIDLRSELEMEPQRQLKGNRLRQDLSDGLIDDDEYHLAMYGKIRPDHIPEMSGTMFVSGGMMVDAEKITPNSDPLGRSTSSAANKTVKSNTNKINR